MLALYLLAAHCVGDYVLQTRWQAAAKLTDSSHRMRHVWAYAVPFVPLVVWRTWGAPAGSWHAQRGVVFVVLLVVLHFWTDSRRFRSTVGDWLVWRGVPPERRAEELQDVRLRRLSAGEYHSADVLLLMRPTDEAAAVARLPANPWDALPMMIDQTLHLCQLAVLGGLLLS